MTKCKFVEDGIKCTKEASYGYRIDMKRLRCLDHKVDDMIGVAKKLCEKCDTTASYGYIMNNPLCCVTHKSSDMKNVTNTKKCEADGCETRPSYGYPDIGKLLRCSPHALEGMEDLTKKKCEECSRSASFGYHMKKPLRCAEHRLEGMEDVVSKRCLKCKRCPSFGYPSDNIPIMCSKHVEEGMVDVKHRKCEEYGCMTQPSYGYLSDGIILRCVDHQLNGMENLKSKRCISCSKIPKFGYPSDCIALTCFDHQLEGMENVSHPRCEHCSKIACFGYVKNKPLRCSDHKETNMDDVTHKKCVSCGLFRVEKRNNYLCVYCNTESRFKKTREMEVINYLTSSGYNFIHNKSTGFSCGSYRPDILFDVSTHFIIVEVDEDQHSQYEQSCENVRMFNILQAQSLPCVFLRYNPDSFKFNGIKQKYPQNERLLFLIKHINLWLNTVPKKSLTCIRLFYDNDDEEYASELNMDEKYSELISSINT